MRRAKQHRAPEPARPGQRRIERVRQVRRADEEDLQPLGLRARQAQRDPADPRGDEVDGVERRVAEPREQAPEHARAVDAVHHHEQLVERARAAAAHASGHDVVVDPPQQRDPAGSRRGRVPLEEKVVARGARLACEVRARAGREHGCGEPARAAQPGTPRSERVDLVDEDDALPAPLARQALGLPAEPAHGDHVEPHEDAPEARPGHGHEGRVEARRERLREHRLAGAGRADEEQPALALAAGGLVVLAGLPELHDALHLGLHVLLAAHVVEAHAPARVTRLEGLDLADPEQEQRAHDQEDVGEEERANLEEQRERRGREDVPARLPEVADPTEGRGQVAAVAGEDADQRDHEGGQHAEPPDEAPDEPPGRRAPPRLHVALDQLVLGAEQVRPRDQPPAEDVEGAAKERDGADGREQRERRAHLAHLREVQPDARD